MKVFLRSALMLLVGLYVLAGVAVADDLQQPAPGKKIKVFVLAGQSNMEGRADGEKLSAESHARLEGVQDRVQLAFNGHAVAPLDIVKPTEGIGKSYQVEKIFGPELFFGIGLAEAWPEEQLLVIKYSAGGTSLYGAWNPEWKAEKAAVMGEEKDPKLYSDMIAHVKEVLSGYDTNSYEICAALWVQGETDSENEMAAAAYGVNLRTLVESFRHDLGEEDLPFLLFQVGKGEVVGGMKDVAREVPGVALIPQSFDSDSPDFYQKIPNGHYNHEGQKKLGLRFATVFLDGNVE